MRGFSVLDVNGNLKVTPYPSGVNLPDPVTVPHGGTGLTTTTQGDLLYGSAANVLSKLAKDTGGLRVLTNQGANNNPVWQDPSSGFPYVKQPTTKKWAMSEIFAGSSTPQSVGWTVSASDGTPTSVVDSITSWSRVTCSASSGTHSRIGISADWARLDHVPTFKCYIRTGSDITNIRYWITISNTTAAIGNADDQHALKGVGIRYSSAADSGNWVGWTADGTTQTISSAITPIAASTIYPVVIQLTSTSSFTITIAGVSLVMAVPAGALATNMRPAIQLTTTTNSAKFFDWTAMYGEWS